MDEENARSSTPENLPPSSPTGMPEMPDAPDKEKMDEIRARRIAKLGGAARTGSNLSDDNASEKPNPSSSTQKASITPAKPSLPGSNPFAALVEQAEGSAGRKRQGTSSNEPPARKPNPPRLQTVEEFADRVLTEILHATVDPDKAAAHPHWKFLPQLSEELKGDGAPLQLSLGNFDQAVIEAATAVPDSQPLLSFLLPCWQRAQNERSHPPRDGNPEKIHVLTEAKRLCVANCFFALAMPELFNRETPDDLAFHLLKSPTDPLGIDHEFIDEAIRRFSDIESLADIFTEAMVSISQRLSSMNMEVSSYRQCIDALTLYTRFPVLLGNLTKHPSFNMDTTAREIEDQTFLGPFFKLSPLKKEVLGIYFPTPRVMDQGSVARAQDATRQVVAGLHNDLYHIANSFVRVGKEARGHLLDWFAQIVNKNHKRRALQVDPTKVASDGFMMNVNAILDRICLPVTDNKNFEKVGNIDINYFRQKPRVDISDETKLNADQARSDAFYQTKAGGEPGFVSEIFFLTLASHHYGLEAVTTKLKALERDIRAYQRHVAQMEDQRTRIRPTASEAQLQVVDRAVTKHVQALERAMRLKFGLEGLINDRKTQGSSLSFLRYVSVWLIRVASQTKYNPSPLKTKEKEGETAEVTLPFPPSTEAFACLPEYAVQNVVDSVKFCYRHMSDIVDGVIGDEMVVLCVSFLQCSEFIKNPYLKASLVSLLFYGTWEFQRGRTGSLVPFLKGSKFANNYLLHALLKFYIECESTGMHTQFYDKFNIRYEIFQVIKTVWDMPAYHRQLTRESETNRTFFVKFVNLLLNDATYVLDEALSKFPRIHTLEVELRGQLSQEDKQKKEEELQRLADQATSYMQLANETLAMMKGFTKALLKPFTMPEIVQRLASMLNYNLATLAGPKCGNLKVENAEKYHFRPRELLSDFVDIYNNLGSSQAFVEAVAADGRSYTPEVFEKAATIVQNRINKDPAELQAFNTLRGKFHQAYILAMQAEMDLGEIPAEYEDPISAELMKDPVLLPSKQIVDRSTISQHLLSDPMDPFTRQPMTIDDVIPDVELKARIDQWKAERIAGAKARIAAEQEAAAAQSAGAAGLGGDLMDTTEG